MMPRRPRCRRFLFFSTGSGRLIGGSQEALYLVSGSHYVDLQDTPVPIERLIDGRTMSRLMTAAEATFNRSGTGSLMKCITVRATASPSMVSL